MFPHGFFATLWAGTEPPPGMPPLGGRALSPNRAQDSFRVLMVDDEEMIRRLAGGMARRLQIDTFDVLIADDLLGEGTDGIELARRLALAQPWLSVVLMSGYSASHFELEGLPADTQFLTKPFSSESLAQCLAVIRERLKAEG